MSAKPPGEEELKIQQVPCLRPTLASLSQVKYKSVQKSNSPYSATVDQETTLDRQNWEFKKHDYRNRGFTSPISNIVL